MTEGTTQSAEDRAREAIRDWAELVDMDGEWLSAAIVSLFEEYQFTIIDTDELAQLRAEHEALAAFADGVQKYAPKPVTGCCDDDGACYPPENCRGFREWQEWVVNCAAVEPILARRRAAQEGELTWQR